MTWLEDDVAQLRGMLQHRIAENQELRRSLMESNQWRAVVTNLIRAAEQDLPYMPIGMRMAIEEAEHLMEQLSEPEPKETTA
jgi:hypothetical protein